MQSHCQNGTEMNLWNKNYWAACWIKTHKLKLQLNMLTVQPTIIDWWRFDGQNGAGYVEGFRSLSSKDKWCLLLWKY